MRERCGGAYSLGNRKEGAKGWRECGEARAGNAGKGAEAAGEGKGCGGGAERRGNI